MRIHQALLLQRSCCKVLEFADHFSISVKFALFTLLERHGG